jgi:hypothetical protein
MQHGKTIERVRWLWPYRDERKGTGLTHGPHWSTAERETGGGAGRCWAVLGCVGEERGR